MSEDAFAPEASARLLDTAGIQWFWDNYKKCLKWQENHQLAYFKAKAAALEFENNILHEQILHLAEQNENLFIQNQSLDGDGSCPWPVVDYDFGGHHQQYSAELMNIDAAIGISDDGHNDDDDGGIEPSEELMKFLEISVRHKMEMKKLREEKAKGKTSRIESKDGENSVSDKEGEEHIAVPNLHKKEKRAKEMVLLYGEAAPKIHAMETAVQLSFNRNSDLHQPILWPNIPLNLDYAEDLPR